MLALMHPQSSNPSPAGPGYWYGSNSLPDALDGVPQDGSNPRTLRRASEAVVQATGFQSQEQSEWDASQGPLHLDSTSATLAIRPQAVSASAASAAAAAAAHKAPLAPKQGLGGALVNARGQHQSPISGTYALRTPRGKITSIACESCRKRKSKCDGVRPKCNTCQSKNLTCVYDVAEDGKTTTQLRAHLRRITKENEELRAMMPLVARAPRGPALNAWAEEMEKNAFHHHLAEDVKKALLDPAVPPPGIPDGESFGTPSSEPFHPSTHGIGASSYDGSSREESREQSQSSLAYAPENAVAATAPMNPPQLDLETQTSNLNKFGFDCAYYRRSKLEMLRTGWNPVEVFGSSEIDVDTVLLGSADTHDNQSVATWCSRSVNKLLPTSPLSVRLASAWVLTKLMRYMIWPTVENMNANPDWLIPPMGKQETSPYDMLIDLVPWPQVRQLLYQHPQEYPVVNMIGLIGIMWPYAEDACHYWDIDAGYTRLTPLFETTVADLNSWTIDPKLLDLMPQLEGHIPLKPVA